MVRNYTAVDIETTGLNPKMEKIIEVGAVRVRDGKITDKYESLVYPGKKLEERIEELTGITQDELLGAPMPDEVIPRLLSFIGEDVILGHSVMFDYSFIKRAAVNLGVMKSKDTMMGLDTLKIARCYLSELESRSLPNLCKHFEITHKAHRALDDAEATVMLYEKLVDKFKKFEQESPFTPVPLVYHIKRESPISERQKERLYMLVDKHKLIIDYDIDSLTRNEANRTIDKIIFQYGK